MDMVKYDAPAELPVVASADVVVVGGGPGGLGAAVFAARAGADVLLVEKYGCLGGMASIGEVHPFMGNGLPGEDGGPAQPFDRPVFLEWADRMETYFQRKGARFRIPKDASALAAEDLCQEAGVKLLYHHALVDAMTDERMIASAVLHGKSGLVAVTAKQFVDCTGDADLAARAGCEFEIGGPTGHCQPMTLCFKLCNLERDRFPSREEIHELFLAAKESGEIECPRENILSFEWLQDDVLHFNSTRVIHKLATEGDQFSAAEEEGHKQLKQLLAFYRKHIPGAENACLLSMGAQIGVRESRRVLGIKFLKRESFTKREHFDDAIARVNYCIDIHSPDGSGTEIEKMDKSEWYEIPYGCVVARDIDNLTIGGRPISVDHAVHSSMRVMPPAVSTGQAAGLGAAMALAQGCRPADLDGVAVRQRLVEMGAWL